MKTLDINNWERQQLFEHFMKFSDPYFGVTFKVDVTQAYKYSKTHGIPFFVKYLHACMQAINAVENLRYRIEEENQVIVYDTIHASATILRPDKTFGFSFINFDKDIRKFLENFEEEKRRILNSKTLFPPVNSKDCIHCSAIPWIDFTGHKEPDSGAMDSVPKIAFGKVNEEGSKRKMSIAICVNHALADGYHVGLFKESFQKHLNT